MLYPYEDISNIDRKKAVYAAEKIIKDGWVRRSYPLVRLDDIPWKLKNQDERSWNFYIHCWDMLDSLLKAHSETQNNEFLKPAVVVALDWAAKHEDHNKRDISPFAWYDMAVGLRSYRLAYISDAVNNTGLLDCEKHSVLWYALEQHQRYLAKDSNIAFHNNHGYYQVAGQLAMGRRFAKKSPLMARAYEQGRQRLKQILKQQFSEEGVHLEHSPDYHRMVYDTLRALIDADLVDDSETIAFANKIEESLSWFVLPNQHIVNFGDTDYRLLRRKPAEAERKWHTPAMRYMVSNGRVGELPAKIVADFQESGYFIIRKPAEEDPNDLTRFSYLAQTAAFHSRTHKHADDLSFIWFDRGSDILVDAGRYGYIGKIEQGSKLWKDGHWYSDPNRVYCETTRAHNTLEFDGKNYPRRMVKPYGSALRRWVEDTSGVIAVETECKHFASIRRARLLVILPGKWLLVFDWFHDNLIECHDVRQWFHLAPHLQTHQIEAGYLVPVPSSAKPLRITSLLNQPQPSRLFIGEEQPVLQGWWSPKEREIMPNYAFCFQLSNVHNGVFATLFSFSENLTVDKNWSKVNVSGRKGQFRWSDDSGTKQICFARPAEGNMNFSFKL